MDDLVNRLRVGIHTSVDPLALTNEAADRIEAQDKRNKELEAALREIKAMTFDPEFGTPPIENAINVARAALGEKKDG